MDLVEKYQIKYFDDVIEQEHIVALFKRILKSPELFPRKYILNGPYGVGKTSSVYAFINELKKKEKVKFYEYDSTKLNKDSIKDLCNTIQNSFSFSKEKFVLLFEEIQGIIRKDTQDSLLKILEKKYDNVYYFFTTTEYDKLVDPLKSRCIKLVFYSLSDEAMIKYIKNIVEIENLNMPEDIINTIVKVSDGHVRDALQYLNIYNISGEHFDKLISNTSSYVEDYLYNDKDISIFRCFLVDSLLKGLNIFVENFIKSNIISNYTCSSKFLELYLKYKNYITSIEDFNSVILILKNFLKNNFKKD